MKTTKVIPHFLAAGVLIIGTACSSTTGTGSGTTTGGSTATNSGMDASSGTSASAGTAGIISGAGAAGTGTGVTGTAGTSGSVGTGTAGVGATGTAAAADQAAFAATFATMQDPVFLLTTASSNLLELQAGKLAAQQATNADVKKFAQMMVDHHTEATQQLQAVATPLGVKPSQTLMPVHQAMLDRLQAKTGKDFDEEYMDLMETAHQLDIAMFEVKSKAAETPAVQSFATKTLPMLRSHQTMADNIEKQVD